MIRDLLADPGRALLAALLALCIILVIPILAALRRRARESERETEREARRRGPVRRTEPREPRFGPSAAYLDDDDDDDDDDEPYLRGRFASGPKRRKPVPISALTKAGWFGFGLAVGVGAMAASGGIASLGDLVRMPIGPGPEEMAQDAAPAPAPKPATLGKTDTGRLPQAGGDPVRAAEEALAALPPDEPAAPSAEPPPAGGSVDAQLAEFVAGVRAQLPMPIGAEINLVKVDAVDRLVTLAFAIQRAIPESGYEALQKTLEERFRAGICNGKDALRIRSLNDSGISFTVLYSDLVGKTVARLEMLPKYCSTGAGSN